ncbi:hypothetical protein KIH39_04935 [Telmatocola sphagniphila]|uniref:Uncharacterized protein n=1 Tax=Telmatocola sphagniphila TaxID=1123043 RepID=A0A8E6EVV3_9BACT|nr:hypothetical protein [Telmatocola sphagniphila]QVL33265.1 hypothetical protein KIH39_04935 [Telmatocola sphagniphila]
MRKWIIGGICAASLFGQKNATFAQTRNDPGLPSITSVGVPQAPQAKYPLVPNAGNFLIIVKSYKDPKDSQKSGLELAEDLADYIKSSTKFNPYIEIRNFKEKIAEENRVKAEKERLQEEYRKLGVKPDGNKISVKRTHIDVEYVVLLGPARSPWKDMESARRWLDEVRKIKTPPDYLCDKIVVGSASKAPIMDSIQSQVPTTPFRGASDMKPLNPFLQSFVVRNPSVAFDDAAEKLQAEKEEIEVWKKINHGQKYNVFECRKNYTLVVKGFSGGAVLQTADPQPTVMEKIFGSSPKQSLLENGALQAEELARVLSDPRVKIGLRPFVFHTLKGSYVCLGEFDSDNDAAINAAKKTIMSTQLQTFGGATDQNGSRDFKTQPLPFRIPGR